MADDDDNNRGENWNTDDEIDNFEWSPSDSPVDSRNSALPLGISDEMLARFMEMGYKYEMIIRADQETGGNGNSNLILESLLRLSANTNTEASSSRSQIINNLIGMGFSEELVVKTVRDYGDDLEDNLEEITNSLASYAEIEKLRQTEDNADENDYPVPFSSDEENELDLAAGDSKLRSLMKMNYSKDEASIAIDTCGPGASMEEIINFITAAQMAKQFDDEEERIRRDRTSHSEPSNTRRRPPNNTSMELIRLPNPMIGFGVPNQHGMMKQRPFPLPEVAQGPPFFYYENVAMAPSGVWKKISSHLYNIMPEFVDSMYFCAAMRKRGYIHNLPIENRVQIQPTPPLTIQEAIPETSIWWPSWDERKQLNCLVTCIGSATTTGKILEVLNRYEGEPPESVRGFVMEKCRKWNLVWVGKNSVAPLDPHEMEQLLGFPKNHTRGGGITRTEQYKSLGNSFQVDTVAYHLSVLKPLFRNGIKVLSLFTGIGGGEVALYRLGIPMKLVVSVEISEVNRNILKKFWVQTGQEGKLIEIEDVKELDREMIERLMDKYGAFDLVIGGSPCNNLAGGNRSTRNGLEGEQSVLFYDYCRILQTVREKAERMRR